MGVQDSEEQKKPALTERVIIWSLLVLVLLIVVPPLFEPEYHGAQVRAELRTLATALEIYRIDHGAYPPAAPFKVWATNEDHLAKYNATDKSGVDPNALKEYKYQPRMDPYMKDKKESVPYAYFADEKGWIAFSSGPNGKYDIDPRADYDSSLESPTAALINKAYDPTNGGRSAGDIFRIHKSLSK